MTTPTNTTNNHQPITTNQQEFHAKYYHPSNGRFWFYGDDDPTKRLAILDSYLSEFEPRAVDSAVATQPKLAAPARVTAHYAAGEGGDDGEEQKVREAVCGVRSYLCVCVRMVLCFLVCLRACMLANHSSDCCGVLLASAAPI